ncbi:MAG TPA: universal stress protein [Bryobacteraceae bacterium]|nr:universal stress protein [Bryobacteraceae bacterium]
MSIQHILFPFDFSPPGFQAARYVQAAAERFSARVTLITVVAAVFDISDTLRVEQDLQARLEGALTEELAGVTVERIATQGEPAERIVEFAHSNGVDLIMMPTYGCGFFRNLLIGSVTAKVLHDARCPVWTSAHAEQQQSRPAPQSVLCAVGGTDGTAALMEWAARFSDGAGATLELLHVIPPVNEWLALPGERGFQEELRHEAWRKLEALSQATGVNAPLRIAAGPVAATVAAEARREGADLVIIGRGSLQSPLGRLRTHAYGIVQKSPCPVLSV